LDVAHGGTGTSTLGNFVDLTSDQTITGNKTFTGNTKVGTLSATTVDVNGSFTAGATTLTSATITGISSITTLTGSKLVLADENNTLRSLDILDEEHGGTGSKVKNFVDLTTDQIVDGNKSFTGNTKVGNLTTTFDASIGRDLIVNGKTTLGTTTVTSINKVSFIAPLNGATLNIADGKTLNVSNDATISGSNSGDQSISITGDINANASTGILNATIGAGKVVNNHLANATITGAKIAANTVGTTNIANLAVSAA
jgi:hypothetical protein